MGASAAGMCSADAGLHQSWHNIRNPTTPTLQDYNMGLLDTLLESRIRMIDYECITEGGKFKGKRLVAFGRYAGVAGMIDFIRGLGERCLATGYSTPFLNVGSSYMYQDVETAAAAVSKCGAAIAEYGLPEAITPFIVAFTGRGNVSKGAQEICALLPHKVVTPEELPDIVANATGKDKTHTVYMVQVTAEHMARKRKSRPTSLDLSTYTASGAAAGHASLPAPAEFFDPEFQREHYRAHPGEYEGVFHVAIAPYVSAIVNCMYWDAQFPRLMTLAQSRALTPLWRCVGICDISCDHMGSIELLKEFTSIDEPFYVYDTATDDIHRGEEGMSKPGILFHAVDHLPSELPADASKHFGDALAPMLPALANSDGSKPFSEQDDLPVPLKGAVITAHGELTPTFAYIAELRRANERARATRGLKRSRRDSFLSVRLTGHLFDTGVINRVLDAVEDAGCSANIAEVDLGEDRDSSTSLSLQVFSPEPQGLVAALGAVGTLVAGTDGVEVTDAEGAPLEVLEEVAGEVAASPMATQQKFASSASAARLPLSSTVSGGGPVKVLLLGAGFVSGPLADYLLRRPSTSITVASMFKHEADAFAAARPRVTPIVLNVAAEEERLGQLVAQHDLVVSLVPAPFHPLVAKAAIAAKKHMVTASYISPELEALGDAAKAAGICILNEAGLDPGIDHISAVALLDKVRSSGSKVLSFSSVCGGLPAPEAAGNRLGYKFSWSPRGVLTASRNAAAWLSGARPVEVEGPLLMSAAAPFRLAHNPAFALEVLPNRNSTPYADKYGIAGVPHIFRGTLRYAGFPKLMFAFAQLGFLSLDASAELQTGEGESSPDFSKGPPMRGVLAQCVGVDPAEAVSGAVDDTALTAAILGKVIPAWEAAAAETASARLATDVRTAAAAAAGEDVAASAWGKGDSQQLEEVLRALDFYSATTPAPRTQSGSPLDTFTAILSNSADLAYAAGERDAALMQHEVYAVRPDGCVERHVSTLIQYGDIKSKITAMSKTVGVTAAIGAQLILDGRGGGKTAGVAAPVTKDWWAPMLEALEEEGIAMAETSEVLPAEVGEAVKAYLASSA